MINVDLPSSPAAATSYTWLYVAIVLVVIGAGGGAAVMVMVGVSIVFVVVVVVFFFFFLWGGGHLFEEISERKISNQKLFYRIFDFKLQVHFNWDPNHYLLSFLPSLSTSLILFLICTSLRISSYWLGRKSPRLPCENLLPLQLTLRHQRGRGEYWVGSVGLHFGSKKTGKISGNFHTKNIYMLFFFSHKSHASLWYISTLYNIIPLAAVSPL